MDGDQNELGTVGEGNVDIGPQTLNNLDLNVEDVKAIRSRRSHDH